MAPQECDESLLFFSLQIHPKAKVPRPKEGQNEHGPFGATEQSSRAYPKGQRGQRAKGPSRAEQQSSRAAEQQSRAPQQSTRAEHQSRAPEQSSRAAEQSNGPFGPRHLGLCENASCFCFSPPLVAFLSTQGVSHEPQQMFSFDSNR